MKIDEMIDALRDAKQEAWTQGYKAGYATAKTASAGDPQHAAPTYISGSSDRVYLISEMPTRYIRNVLKMSDARQACGLVCALRDELSRRGERE